MKNSYQLAEPPLMMARVGVLAMGRVGVSWSPVMSQSNP